MLLKMKHPKLILEIKILLMITLGDVTIVMSKNKH